MAGRHDDYYYQNNYANAPQSSFAYHDSDPYHRNEAPLPPLQPSNSPFNDNTYPYQNSPAAHSQQSRYDTDPFDDHNAIPLKQGRGKRDSTQSVAPILPHQEDDFIRDSDPRRSKRRRDTGDGTAPKEDGWFRGKITWVCFFFSVVQLIVYLVETIKYGILTGIPIQTQPSFNPMIGPSPYLLINMGARYGPCMRNVANIQNATEPISWPCPGMTSTTGDDVSCTLSNLCGMGGVPNPRVGGSINDTPFPNQWWRFIIPMFMHAGIIHIGFNLLLQLTLGRDVEKLIGSIRFALVYLAAGIFGFVLGGNFAATGIASTGASGSLFGILAITLLDLLYNWPKRKSPWKELAFIVIDIVIAFVLGLLPGLDNFSHIGGFLMGLVLGVCVLRSPSTISRRTSADFTAKAPADMGIRGFVKQPLTFFQGRRGVWWAWWLVRAAALLGALIGFILLLRNFYEWRTGCSWCKHLSCLPITVGGTDWCDIGNLQFTSRNETRINSRSIHEEV